MQSSSIDFDSTTLSFTEPIDSQIMDQEGVDVDIVGLPSTDVDEELLQSHFEREEPLLAKHIASGSVTLQFIEQFKKMGVDERRGLANTLLQLSDVDGNRISTPRVERFAKSSEETRERAIHLTTFRPVFFHKLSDLHLWMKRQPDVSFTWTTSQSDNDNVASAGTGRISYRRGAYVLELDPTVPIHMLGRRVEALNKTLLEAFGDKAYKPQLRVIDERILKIAAEMLLVGTLQVNPETNQYRYVAYQEPIAYRPHWKSAEIPMPSTLVGYLKGLWAKHFRYINKAYRLECVNNLEYIVNQLVANRVEGKLRDVLNVPFTSDIRSQFETELEKAKAKPDVNRIAKEIDESNAALAKSRGFRGAKGDLDALTHSMFEVHQLGELALDEDLGHARLIGSLHMDLLNSKLKSIAVYDHAYAGKTAVMHQALLKEAVPYASVFRVDVLGEAKPSRMEKSEKGINDIDLHHLTVDIPIRTQAVAWFVQFESSKTEQSYIETHRGSYEKLRDIVKTYHPQVVYVPIQLSYLNADHPLAEIVGGAKTIKPMVAWSRSHNAEVWFRIEMNPEPGMDDANLLKFNVLQVLVGRRLRLCNYMRDYLISGGHIDVNLGVIVDSATLAAIGKVYCLSKKVVESSRVVASTWKGVTPSEKPVDVDIDADGLFPELGAPKKVPHPRESRFDSRKTKRDQRSPSVSSTGSVDSRVSDREEKRSWASDEEEERASLVDNRKPRELPPSPIVEKAKESPKKAEAPAKKTVPPRKASRSAPKKPKK